MCIFNESNVLYTHTDSVDGDLFIFPSLTYCLQTVQKKRKVPYRSKSWRERQRQRKKNFAPINTTRTYITNRTFHSRRLWFSQLNSRPRTDIYALIKRKPFFFLSLLTSLHPAGACISFSFFFCNPAAPERTFVCEEFETINFEENRTETVL